LDEDRAIGLEPVTIRIQGEEGGEGEVVLRYAWLPPSFAATDKTRDAIGINANERFPIIKQYHGIIFSRNGRLLDVQSRTPWTMFLNNDRYIRVEVEFSAALDEAFGVTTSKQQVSVSPEMWDRLRVAGLHKAIEHLRAKVRAAKSERIMPEPQVMAVPPQNVREKRDNRSTVIPRGITPARALGILLDEIECQSATAKPAIQAAYRNLLSGWSERMFSLTSGSAQAKS
jgi:hypothetical protein